MRSVSLRRPDGRTGTYGAWLQGEAATWLAASAEERAASQREARERHAVLNAARPKAADGATIMLVYDEIGFWGITAADLVTDMQAVSGDLELHLNTPGGDVFDGISIANALKQRAGQVRVIVDGIAASIGSVIAMAASPGQLVMMPNSTMMIHDAWGMCVGNAADMAAMKAILEQQSDNIADIYASRSGTSAAGWRDVMRAESWMVGQEAVDAGLADSLGKPPAQVAAAVAERMLALPQVVIHDSPRRRMRLGLESMPLADKAMPVHHTATVDAAWDGPAAVRAMPNDDTVLEYCHAWQDSEAAGTPHREGDDDADDRKSNYKFPHHERKGGPANLAACRNGLARLSGADIPDGDRAGVKAHLQAHLDDGHDDDETPGARLTWSAGAFTNALTGKED